jgi:peroxiredoxin
MGIHTYRMVLPVLLVGLGGFACTQSRSANGPTVPGGAAAVPLRVTPVKNDPAAHALYDGMVAALRAADSLYLECEHAWWSPELPKLSCTYKLWLQKPNEFRMEAAAHRAGVDHPGQFRPDGVLVGDGEHLWLYWPDGRPRFSTEIPEQYEATRRDVYMTKPTPPARHSIGHEAALLGADMAGTILDPSTFHGYTDSLQPHLDGVRCDGVAEVAGEPCDILHVSFIAGQREWLLWVARRDHLPRKIHQVVHVNYDLEAEEIWTKISLNESLAAELFHWQPPDGWKEWNLPTDDELLLQPGQPAPDFDLALADGRRTKLSSYRGKVVWLVFWRVGCPACPPALLRAEKLHQRYAREGLVVLGFNSTDQAALGTDHVKTHGMTYPTVLDSSPEAQKMLSDYRINAVPTTYVIDRDGRVAAAWTGGRDSTTIEDLLAKLGLRAGATAK